jgi:hypothetical protein
MSKLKKQSATQAQKDAALAAVLRLIGQHTEQKSAPCGHQLPKVLAFSDRAGSKDFLSIPSRQGSRLVFRSTDSQTK